MNNDISLNLKNIIILSLAFMFLSLSILHGFKTAKDQKQKKIQKFMNMSFFELGQYIVKKNNSKNNIDFITYIKPIRLKNDTLIVDYYVEDGFFYDTSTSLVGHKKIQKYIFNDLVSENCTKTAHRTFLKRGGKIRYSYYLVKKDEEDKFLFTFDIVESDCKQEYLRS